MAFEAKEWKTGDEYPAARMTELEAAVVAKAAKGDKGDPGKDGKDGAPGKDGEKGDPGVKGDPGKDAEAQFTADEVTKLKALAAEAEA